MATQNVPGKLRDPDAESAKPNREILAGMEASSGLLPAMFIPQSFGEVMEFAKLMAQAGAAIPEHLRGNPGACFAVAVRAYRWRMDPFAVAEETYFVNGRIAYQAKIVNAVVNTCGRLDGRLAIEWEGEGENLVCIVTGYVKGDDRAKKLVQPLKTIKTRNSPLWVQAPHIQIAYYTTRAWGRVYMPEALLGIYTPEEIESAAQERSDQERLAQVPAGQARPALASYAQVAQSKADVTIGGEAVEEPETSPATPESAPPSGGKGEGGGKAPPKAKTAPAASPGFSGVNWDGEVVEFKTPQAFTRAVCDWLKSASSPQDAAGILESNLGEISKLADELQAEVNTAHAETIKAFDQKQGHLV